MGKYGNSSWLRLLTILLSFIICITIDSDAAERRLQRYVYNREFYISVREMARFYGFRVNTPSANRIQLKNKVHTLEWEINTRKFWFDNNLIWLNAPISKTRGYWAVKEVDLKTTIDPLLRPDLYLKNKQIDVVILDPGHGGKDRGASGPLALTESRVVLDIAYRVRSRLLAAGLKVHMTRDNDTFIELNDRCYKAAAVRADLFVSIHLNSSRSDTTGQETYILTAAGYPSTNNEPGQAPKNEVYRGNNFNPENTLLGYYLHKRVAPNLHGDDRGLRRARFLVLREAPCPAALVECGFISSLKDEALFNTAIYRQLAAKSIAEGILDYVTAAQRAKARDS